MAWFSLVFSSAPVDCLTSSSHSFPFSHIPPLFFLSLSSPFTPTACFFSFHSFIHSFTHHHRHSCFGRWWWLFSSFTERRSWTPNGLLLCFLVLGYLIISGVRWTSSLSWRLLLKRGSQPTLRHPWRKLWQKRLQPRIKQQIWNFHQEEEDHLEHQQHSVSTVNITVTPAWCGMSFIPSSWSFITSCQSFNSTFDSKCEDILHPSCQGIFFHSLLTSDGDHMTHSCCIFSFCLFHHPFSFPSSFLQFCSECALYILSAHVVWCSRHE